MAETRILDDDVVKVYEDGAAKRPEALLATLFWGDRIKVAGERDGQLLVRFVRRRWDRATERWVAEEKTGILPKKARFREEPLLKVRFVDVGQGDAAVIESPGGRLVLVDGGEEDHLRNYVGTAFGHRVTNGRLAVDAAVVTHGDADHFGGLTKLANVTRADGTRFLSVARVFHNGLAKGSATKDVEAFGRTRVAEGKTYVVDLVDDLTAVPDARLNAPFRAWKKALSGLGPGGANPEIRRLAYGDDAAFSFLASEGVRVKVLGPIVETVGGVPALPFLRTPGSSSLSASHTVNGHSIVLQVSFGNVRFLFGADLNEEAEERLVERARRDGVSLASEVLKVPHHGSADFSPRILEAIRPVVSVVSSGDENATKEYIHPRAGLVGALGRYSRASVERPLVYVTEMVAFFERLGDVTAKAGGPLLSGRKVRKELGPEIHNAYRKTTFGIVHVRTDGARVLVVTHSGKDDQKESYAFRVDPSGGIAFEEKTRVL